MLVELFLQDTKDHIILAMELCDCDLDQYVKEKSFDENKVKTFLYQMSKWSYRVIVSIGNIL